MKGGGRGRKLTKGGGDPKSLSSHKPKFSAKQNSGT